MTEPTPRLTIEQQRDGYWLRHPSRRGLLWLGRSREELVALREALDAVLGEGE